MEFALTDDQRMLVDTVASFVKKDSPVSRARAMRDDPLGWSRDVLRKMGDLGWLGVAFPESVGGLGGSFVDVMLMLEQLGSTLVPEPLLSSMILSGFAVLHAGTSEQHARWLPSLIDGSSTLALAYAEEGSRYDLARVATTADKSAKGYTLRGKKRFVLDGNAASAIVVSARTSGKPGDREGVSLFVVDPGASGLRVTGAHLIDGRRATMLELAGVEVEEGRRLGDEGNALGALERAIDSAAAAACAEGLGIMDAVLTMTRDYLSQREQFGVKIGTFQALQHRAVDMFVETELARSTAILAALSIGNDDAIARQRGVSAAKVQLAIGGRFVTQQSIQLHGGVGITEEHDVGLYFKRMQALDSLFGDEEHHVRRFADLTMPRTPSA